MTTRGSDTVASVVITEPDNATELKMIHKGLTKREYFIAAALQGLLAHPDCGREDAKWIAKTAVDQADTLLEVINN